jgi:hypothetical protein
MTDSMTRQLVRAAAVVALLAVAAPAAAQRPYRGVADSEFRIRVGQFEPRGDSAYWDDTFDVFTGSVDQFDDIAIGADYVLSLGRRSGLMFSLDGYEGEDDQAYLDFVDTFGSPIVHTTRLEFVSATAAYVLSLTGRDAAIVPYVGIGGGVYDWELEESGDFIDFGVVPAEIFTDSFRDGNTTLGWFWLVGVDVPIGPRWSVFAEGRWQRLDEELDGDFEGLGDLDLSGRHIFGGFGWRF